MLRNRDGAIQELFKIINEIREEYRLDHPIMDKLSKMADEWGIEDFDSTKNS